MGLRSFASGFGFLANPKIAIALAAIIAIIYFRKPIGEAFGSVGTGLGTFGTGLNTFISQVASPKIEPTFGLKLTGIFGDAANYAGQLIMNDVDKSKTSNQNTSGTPAGVTGGQNLAQSTAESNPGSYIYDRLVGDQFAFWKGLSNWGK